MLSLKMVSYSTAASARNILSTLRNIIAKELLSEQQLQS